MTQAEKAKLFAGLHIKGNPLKLYNAWDAGSAKAVAAAGAAAIATSSWAVAEAQGYRDGEDLPLDFALQLIARMAASTSLPLTADFEGGYSDDDAALAGNIERVIAAGAIGINFEDRVVKGQGLYDIDRQARRIAAIRQVANRVGIALFINARTDLFLGQGRDPAEATEEALARGAAYAAAGASGFFIPGLVDAKLIGRIAAGVSLPVNVMVLEGVPPHAELARLGVARISYGALPYIQAARALQDEAAIALG